MLQNNIWWLFYEFGNGLVPTFGNGSAIIRQKDSAMRFGNSAIRQRDSATRKIRQRFGNSAIRFGNKLTNCRIF